MNIAETYHSKHRRLRRVEVTCGVVTSMTIFCISSIFSAVEMFVRTCPSGSLTSWRFRLNGQQFLCGMERMCCHWTDQPATYGHIVCDVLKLADLTVQTKRYNPKRQVNRDLFLSLLILLTRRSLLFD